jgi:ATP-dependent DNA helicase RecG
MMNTEDILKLVENLLSHSRETEWIEFKLNYADPEKIGEYIAALSNSPALYDEPSGYIVWGIEDETHKIVGTNFKPFSQKVKNQEIENWLATQLNPRIDIRFYEASIPKPVVILEIQPARSIPTSFRGAEFIRIGSYKKKLIDHPEKARQLWQLLSTTTFESGIVVYDVDSDDVLDLIDYPAYFKLMEQRLPDNRSAILEKLLSKQIIKKNKNGQRYDITNVGAVLFANKLGNFERLARKAPRVIIYKGNNRVEAIKEQDSSKGYAIGFEGLIAYINDQLPQNEYIGKTFRKEVRMYPEIAIRELVANALLHQDFTLTGTGPKIEVFTDRMEISNPGKPLIDTLRFIDEPPKSRNEKLVSLMRRMNICEERGSGIDKVISYVEKFQLPAPDFRVTQHHTVAVLYGPRDLSDMDREEKIRACYQHTCLCCVSGKQMTNTTLRKRLKIEDKNYPMASRIIKETMDEGLIKRHTQDSNSKKDSRYVPFWA